LKTLVLGASGFVGSYIMPRIAKSLPGGYFHPTRSEILEAGEGSVLVGLVNIIKAIEPTVIFNFIAETSIQKCQIDQATSRLANVEVPVAVAGELAPNSLIVHLSSDAVFGGGSAPYSSLDSTSPKSAYGRQKSEADSALLSLRDNLLIIRGSFYGPSKSGRLGTYEFFKSSLDQGLQVQGFSDYVNNPISLDDLSGYLSKAIPLGVRGLRHLGSEKGLSKYEFGKEVARVIGAPQGLVSRSLAPEGFHAFGGLDLTLDSGKSWEEVRLKTPTIREGLIRFSYGNA
jgi:dTDP-4-dehydrorhamnose reductase